MPTKKRRAACPTVPSLAPTLTFSNPDRRSHAPNTRLNSGRQPSSTPHVTHGGKSGRGGGALSLENDRGYPLKLYFLIPCVFPVFFPVRLQIFCVPIYIICEYYIHRTDLADLSSFWKKMDFFRGNYRNILYF